MATINDVAKKAGVGVSTVSKVLNNYAYVSDTTRKKVMDAVDALDYVPNTVASALSSKQNKRIAIVVFINNKRQAIDEINMQYLFGAFNRSKEYKYELVTIFSTMFEDKNKKELIQFFKSLQVQALIVYGLHKEQPHFKEMIEEDHFLSVVVDAPIVTKRTTSVMVDHLLAQYDITKQMIDGFDGNHLRQILYLGGRQDGFVTELRLKGVLKAGQECGVDINVQFADFSERKAHDLCMKYGEKANIVVCASDLMAIGAIKALKEKDIFRPVCGYDGIKLLGYMNYRILTVCQDFFEISESAVDEAHRLFLGEEGRIKHIDYKIDRINYDDVIL